jgi:hypothetical protein
MIYMPSIFELAFTDGVDDLDDPGSGTELRRGRDPPLRPIIFRNTNATAAPAAIDTAKALQETTSWKTRSLGGRRDRICVHK